MAVTRLIWHPLFAGEVVQKLNGLGKTARRRLTADECVDRAQSAFAEGELILVCPSSIGEDGMAALIEQEATKLNLRSIEFFGEGGYSLLELVLQRGDVLALSLDLHGRPLSKEDHLCTQLHWGGEDGSASLDSWFLGREHKHLVSVGLNETEGYERRMAALMEPIGNVPMHELTFAAPPLSGTRKPFSLSGHTSGLLFEIE